MGRASKLPISVTPEACIGGAMLVILIPLPWLLAWFLAAAVHELFHCLALILCGSRIYRIEIGLDGAQIVTGSLSDMHNMLCTLAGPFGGLFLLFSASIFPKLALCALLQSLFNLLPIYPLDGGRAFLSLGRTLLTETAAYQLAVTVKTIALLGLLVFGILAAFAWNLGCVPLVMALLLLMKVKKVKIPCK